MAQGTKSPTAGIPGRSVTYRDVSRTKTRWTTMASHYGIDSVESRRAEVAFRRTLAAWKVER